MSIKSTGENPNKVPPKASNQWANDSHPRKSEKSFFTGCVACGRMMQIGVLVEDLQDWFENDNALFSFDCPFCKVEQIVFVHETFETLHSCPKAKCPYIEDDKFVLPERTRGMPLPEHEL